MSEVRWMCAGQGCFSVLAHVTLNVEVQVRGTIEGLTIECPACHWLNDITKPKLRALRKGCLTERDHDSMLVAMAT